jgi:hypothetical protein
MIRELCPLAHPATVVRDDEGGNSSVSATFTKIDPGCGTPGQIVYTANIGMVPFTEGPEERFAEHPASAELAVDVLAPEGYESVEFEDITIILEILAPAGALFTDHSNRNNYHWDVPDGASGWVENVVASTRLRIRVDASQLISGSGNGLTSYVGVHGLQGQGLHFTAVASASEVRALASSCAITVADLRDGDRLSGYLA